MRSTELIEKRDVMRKQKIKLLIAVILIVFSLLGFRFVSNEVTSFVLVCSFTVGVILFIDSIKKMAKEQIKSFEKDR